MPVVALAVAASARRDSVSVLGTEDGPAMPANLVCAGAFVVAILDGPISPPLLLSRPPSAPVVVSRRDAAVLSPKPAR